MNIASIQVPNVSSKFINSKEALQQEDFSIVLSEILTVENQKTEETSDLINEQPKLVDDETDAVEENLLPLFFNMGLYESKDKTLSLLDKNASMENIVLVDESISSNKSVFQPHTYVIKDQVDLFTTTMDTSSTESNSVVYDNMIVIQEPLMAIQEDNSLDIELKVDKLPSEKISTPEKVIMDQTKNKLFEEEDLKAIKVKEETSITKDKDTDVQENKWLSNPIREFGKTNFSSNISAEKPELFGENIQAVNDSIIELVETNTVGDSSIMKVRLNPKELGTVNITLKMEEGKLVAKILVDSSYVKELFAGKINELNEGLNKHNIFIEKIQIDLNTNLEHNLNSNSNPGKDFNQNNKKHYNRDKLTRFSEKPISEVMIGRVDVGLGAISILA